MFHFKFLRIVKYFKIFLVGNKFLKLFLFLDLCIQLCEQIIKAVGHNFSV